MLDFELFIYIFCNKKSTGFLLLSLALNWLQHYLNLEQKSVNAAVELYLSRCATISEHGIIMESSANCNLFFLSYRISFLEVELNLHGLEEKENEHFLVNTGTAYFHQTGSFVMGEESF